MTSELYSGFVGLFMPFLVEFLKAKLPETKGKWLGYLLALIVSIVIGGGSSYFSNQFDPENILSSVGSALIASQAVYNFWFKPKGVDEIINKRFS